MAVNLNAQEMSINLKINLNISLQAENIMLAQCTKSKRQQCTPKYGKCSSDGVKKYTKEIPQVVNQ